MRQKEQQNRRKEHCHSKEILSAIHKHEVNRWLKGEGWGRHVFDDISELLRNLEWVIDVLGLTRPIGIALELKKKKKQNLSTLLSCMIDCYCVD